MSVQDHHQASISLSSHILDTPSLELPMCLNENPPQLTLSDIMHHMSPSPAPAEDPRLEYSEMGGQTLNRSQGDREASPEPLTDTDVLGMRRRLHALGFSLDRDPNELSKGEDLTRHSDDLGDMTLKEKELGNMVLRLTDPLSLDATQLERQADVISVLTSQCDFLVHQAKEDRNRWQSEREGWDRMAEALLSHRNKSGKSSTREDETERQKVQLESENRALRDKLQDTQNRLSSLESELMKLKPLLLMQPYSVAHLRQNFASSQPPNAALTTGRHPDVLDKSTSDIKGKQREADPAPSGTQLEAISKDAGTNEERGLGPSPLARPSHSGSLTSSASVPLFSGATSSTADIYRRSEPLPRYSYPCNYHYSTLSPSPSKSTLIPPKITVNSPLFSSTGHDQSQPRTIAESPSRSLGSAVYPTTPSQSHPLPQASSWRSRDYVDYPGTTQNPPIRRRNHGKAPLTSDARTEHVLLAARRIGRERAGLVAEIKQHAEHEKEKHARDLEVIKTRQDHERLEKERLERLANGTSGLGYYRSTDTLTSPQRRNTGRSPVAASVPRTPKRGGGAGATHYPALSNSPSLSPTRVPATGPSTFVFVNTSAAAGTSGYSGGETFRTPDQLSSVHKRSGTAKAGSGNLPSNPPTPLDSLLNAARSMMDDGTGAGAGGKAGGKINGTRKASEYPESPVPKRRRVPSSGSKTLGRGGGSSTATRVRSALDVLADQAAAAFEDDPGQSGRGSNTRGGKGKGKEKLGDESLSGSGDGGVANVPGDDSWPLGSGFGSTSVSSMGPSRGRSRAKTASIDTRPTVESTSTSSMSLRPIRQASQKHLASRDSQPPSSIPTTATGSRGRSRGRPKGSKSLPRPTVSVKASSTLKMVPSPGPRVIASAPMYPPLDESVALLPQKSKGREVEQSEEHPRWTTADLDRSPSAGSSRLGSKPVVEWGERGAEEDDIEGEGEYLSSLVAGGCELEQNSHVEGNHTDVVEAGNGSTPRAESGSTVVHAETQIKSNVPTTADVDLMTISPVNTVANAEAEADLDDEDAEGEQEEEEDDENAEAEAGQESSRPRTPPPPPDPPHSGMPSESNDDDPDADADAEGEMEFEEELPPTSTSSAMYQTASSMPMGNFYGSFLDIRMMVFWMKPEKSSGYDSCFNLGDGIRRPSVIAVNIVRPIGKDDSPAGVVNSPEGWLKKYSM